MGAIVSVPARSTPVGVSKYLIIDGQQRLTTVSLLLCALRDSLDSNTEYIQYSYRLLNRQFKSEVHRLEASPRGTDRDSLMFTTTKGHPHELLPAYCS